jgi:hypothetical protein
MLGGVTQNTGHVRALEEELDDYLNGDYDDYDDYAS